MKSKILILTMTLIGLFSYSQSRKPIQYRDPVPLDISNLGNASSTLQQRYNYNTQRVQQEIDAIVRQVNKLDITEKQKQDILELFQKNGIASLNAQRLNYSSDAQTNQAINYLYNSVNSIIKIVTE